MRLAVIIVPVLQFVFPFYHFQPMIIIAISDAAHPV